MEKLYDVTTFRCSKVITQLYSTSFSLGIRTLDKSYRPAIYAIYGFVRYADEIVDTFHGFDKKQLLDEFTAETFKAIERGISLNPVLHSFQKIVRLYQIDLDLIQAFLHSMEMDLFDIHYNEQKYKEYIYGSAEVVGLMCLKVFCKDQPNRYAELLPFARSLGSAFQKINFLRDIQSDFEERGRVYFPGIDFSKFTNENKLEIEIDIKKDFDHALQGIRMLPAGAKLGVYIAYMYYIALFKKIKGLPAAQILKERIRVPNPVKIWLLFEGYFKYRFRVV